jgi:phosphinothricin acetyltransferase
MYRIREIKESDRDRIIAIFNHYVVHGFSAYPEEPVPSVFFNVLKEGAHAFLAVEDDRGLIAGFGLMKPYLPFTSFRTTAMVSYFVSPEKTGSGLGTKLLFALEEIARKKGISVLLANISSKNPQSLEFHRKHAFTECGRFPGVGVKSGEPFDVVWMVKKI